MKPQNKIYIAGHRGLVGSALLRTLRVRGYDNILTSSHSEMDLTDQQAVNRFFAEHRPQCVFLAAAKVGGIYANNTYPAEFIYQNLIIQTHVIEAAYRNGVQRLLFLGSSCIYPRDCPQPIREEYLLTGPLEPTNRPYAIAKIAGVELCTAYNRQYGTQYLAVMPTNLYGPGDNFDLQNAHVLPALLRKMHSAKLSDAAEVVVWGTGTPRRELLYSDDLAEACVFLMNLPETVFQSLLSPPQSALMFPLINIGYGQDLTIRELAQQVAEVVGFQGRLRFDSTQPDGTPCKLLDVSRLWTLGWRPRHTLQEGLEKTYAWFLAHQSQLRT